MDPFDALSLCGEVAIAITGFSGVVLVFGGRSPDRSSRAESILFRTLFSGSLIATGLVSIAFVLGAAGLEPATNWRWCSAVHVTALLTSIVASRSDWPDEGERRLAMPGRGGPVVLVGAILVTSLSVSNAILLHAFWPVLVVVWWAIAVSLWAFVSLVFLARAA